MGMQAQPCNRPSPVNAAFDHPCRLKCLTRSRYHGSGDTNVYW